MATYGPWRRVEADDFVGPVQQIPQYQPPRSAPSGYSAPRPPMPEGVRQIPYYKPPQQEPAPADTDGFIGPTRQIPYLDDVPVRNRIGEQSPEYGTEFGPLSGMTPPTAGELRDAGMGDVVGSRTSYATPAERYGDMRPYGQQSRMLQAEERAFGAPQMPPVTGALGGIAADVAAKYDYFKRYPEERIAAPARYRARLAEERARARGGIGATAPTPATEAMPPTGETPTGDAAQLARQFYGGAAGRAGFERMDTPFPSAQTEAGDYMRYEPGQTWPEQQVVGRGILPADTMLRANENMRAGGGGGFLGTMPGRSVADIEADIAALRSLREARRGTLERPGRARAQSDYVSTAARRKMANEARNLARQAESRARIGQAFGNPRTQREAMRLASQERQSQARLAQDMARQQMTIGQRQTEEAARQQRFDIEQQAAQRAIGRGERQRAEDRAWELGMAREESRLRAAEKRGSPAEQAAREWEALFGEAGPGSGLGPEAEGTIADITRQNPRLNPVDLVTRARQYQNFLKTEGGEWSSAGFLEFLKKGS